jgi:indolepyruvate ferredoxin oxidoreductase beta subunit
MKPICVLVTALGGEGGGVLAEWLVETAVRSGFSAQSTSIPGVAQRTGATTYYVEVFPVAATRLDGRTPVFSLHPVAGGLDLLASSELLETVRQVGHGMATRERTHILCSTSRSLTTAEKMVPGDGRASSAALLEVVRTHAREAQAFDMAQMARDNGTVLSAVLFGAIAASGVLPLPRSACEQTIRASDKGAEASLRGFSAAFAAVAALRAERATVEVAVEAAAAAIATDTMPAPTGTDLPPALAAYPADVREMADLGHARLVDYQDARYAALYLARLDRILAAERAGAPDAVAHPTTRAAARWLALWMAFDDIVRVADLKTRASRVARVRREVKAADADVLRIVDHFKPGVAELASLLPRPWADALVRRDRARQARGHETLALPLKIRTDTVFGFLLLRALAAMKALRRSGSRFVAEQAAIERWLEGVGLAARRHAGLGLELAECGRLIKGYGATNERGKDNLLHILDHLALAAPFASDDERAGAIRAAREAALADGSGQALDRALATHGAPPRPVATQPIRWVTRRPGRPGIAGEHASDLAP